MSNDSLYYSISLPFSISVKSKDEAIRIARFYLYYLDYGKDMTDEEIYEDATLDGTIDVYECNDDIKRAVKDIIEVSKEIEPILRSAHSKTLKLLKKYKIEVSE